MLNIKLRKISIWIYIYIMLPIIIFFLSWLKLYVGIPLSLLLIAGLLVILKNDYLNNQKEIRVSKKHYIYILIILLIWTWISGLGGFFYQTWDNHWRNAIFRDLINYKWPVVYSETGNTLSYYITYWIIPAIIGKLFGWVIGNFALLVWGYLGIVLTYTLCLFLIKDLSLKKIWIVALIFMLWSGLDWIGAGIMNIFNEGKLSLGCMDGWLDFVKGNNIYSYQYSSNNTLICWVYNQTIVSWIVILLFLENRKVKNYAFFGGIMFTYAPIPFIGFFVILVINSIPYYINQIKEKKYIEIIKQTFSIPNISVILTIFPIFIAFFKCNSMSKSGLYVPFKDYDIKRISILVLFYFLEFGVYMVILYNSYKKDILYYIIMVSLIFFPIFKIGSGRDLCMRGSIPALFILMIFIIQYCCNQKNIGIKNVLLLIIISLSSINFSLDYLGKLNQMYTAQCFPIICDDIKTFSDKQLVDEKLGRLGHFRNFLCINPDETFFYRYLAK